MRLIAFDDAIVCTCQKRPSSTIKSPYVADIFVNDVQKLGHCPSLGLGGIIEQGSYMIATPSNEKSKTDYVIQAVKDKDILVGNVPLHANRIVKLLLQNNMLLDNVKDIKPEYTCGMSRFDFLVNTDTEQIYCEVKSVHTKINDKAVFPVGYKKPKQETISERANKHVSELTELRKKGHSCLIVFVVQRSDCNDFAPNWEKDPIFANLLQSAVDVGVVVKVVYTDVLHDGIYLKHIDSPSLKNSFTPKE